MQFLFFLAMEINIDSKMRKAIEKELDNPTPTLFDEVQEACWKILSLHFVARFLQSDFYLNYCRKNNQRLSSFFLY